MRHPASSFISFQRVQCCSKYFGLDNPWLHKLEWGNWSWSPYYLGHWTSFSLCKTGCIYITCANYLHEIFTRIKIYKGTHIFMRSRPTMIKKETIRQKRKYPCKILNGVPIKVRSQDLFQKKILSHANLYLCGRIAALPKSRTNPFRDFAGKRDLACSRMAMNYVIRPRSLNHIQSWYEGTILAEDRPGLPLSSQTLSRIPVSHGDSTAN